MLAWKRLSGGAALVLLLAGCAGGAGEGGGGGSSRIAVTLDPSIPDLNAAMIVAQRDCSSRGGMAVLLSTQTAAGSAGARTATFACDEIRRGTGGGNNAMN